MSAAHENTVECEAVDFRAIWQRQAGGQQNLTISLMPNILNPYLLDYRKNWLGNLTTFEAKKVG